MIYECGCQNKLDLDSGIVKNIVKCPFHAKRRDKFIRGKKYYQMLGSVSREGRVNLGSYIQEMKGSLGPLLSPPEKSDVAVEIGGGVSPYVEWIQRAGYLYHGIELDKWAVRWNNSYYKGVNVSWGSFPTDCPFEDGSVGMVLSAHSLEHMKEAPACLEKMYQLLCPDGRLYLLVPDDTDPTNPDHIWFFDQESLTKLLTKVGFHIDKMDMKRVTDKENFIYTLARRVK